MNEYVIRVGNEPDADGDYRAEIQRDGSYLKTIFGRDRAELVEKAKHWAENDRTYDPTNVETITL